MTKTWRVIVLIFVVASAGCNQAEPNDSVVNVSEQDPHMNTAMATARSTVDKFIKALQAPKSGQSSFALKMPISNGTDTERFWLADVTYDGKAFHGTINNEPDTVKTVKIGQAMTVDAKQISDWMYVEDGVLVGGYTMRVLRDAMSPTERADFDKSMPFKMQ